MTDSTRAGDLLASLRRALGTMLSIVETRMELLIVEFDEERIRLGELLLIGAIALLCFGLGIILVAFFVIAYFWDTHRLEAIAALAALFFIAGGFLWRSLAAKAQEKPRLFGASLDELQGDRRSLQREEEEAKRENLAEDTKS